MLITQIMAGGGIPGANGWINAAGRFFKYFSDKKSFADASTFCGSLGGSLAFDDHPEVNALLAESGILISNICMNFLFDKWYSL